MVQFLQLIVLLESYVKIYHNLSLINILELAGLYVQRHSWFI